MVRTKGVSWRCILSLFYIDAYMWRIGFRWVDTQVVFWDLILEPGSL